MLSYTNCRLCPRQCGVDRDEGQTGFCGMTAQMTAARAMLHYGEEPPIAASFGTGAVFFSGCTLRCRYCQNREISLERKGKPISSEELRDIFLRLIDEGAQSIDLVTPTHFLPTILPALTPKLPVPVVYNCGGYERVETLRELEGLVDIYLPDFKYADDRLAARLSDAPEYFDVAAAAICEMYRQVGGYVIEDEQMQRGVLIRHLVLPGAVGNSLRVIEWVARTFPKNDVLFSLMSQYVPSPTLPAPLNRRLTPEEYDGAVSWLELCGIRSGFVQNLSAATDELLPNFDLSGLN